MTNQIQKKIKLTSEQLIYKLRKFFWVRDQRLRIASFAWGEAKDKSVWMFLALDTRKMPKPEVLTSKSWKAGIRTVLYPLKWKIVYYKGQPFLGVQLTSGLKFPEIVSLPEDIDSKRLWVGVDKIGNPISQKWHKAGHILVAGKTGSGKSIFLRSIAWQASKNGHKLYLVDGDGTTFSAMATNPQIVGKVWPMEEAEQAVHLVLNEIEKRIDLFSKFPVVEKLEDYNKIVDEPLPRILLIIDEFNAMTIGLGGVTGSFAKKVQQVAWRGRKFGINLVLAGQDFTKAIVGPVREQMTNRVCFQVSNASSSKVILERAGAELLRTPGRALTTSWGTVQTYYVSGHDVYVKPVDVNQEEANMIGVLHEFADGSVSYDCLASFLKMTRTTAKDLRESWLSRELVVKTDGRGGLRLNYENPLIQNALEKSQHNDMNNMKGDYDE